VICRARRLLMLCTTPRYLITSHRHLRRIDAADATLLLPRALPHTPCWSPTHHFANAACKRISARHFSACCYHFMLPNDITTPIYLMPINRFLAISYEQSALLYDS
jgi:hypothetical protein